MSAVPAATVTVDGREQVAVDRLLPVDARRTNLDDVLAALTAGGVAPFVVDDRRVRGSVVGVLPEQRTAAVAALAAGLPAPGRYLREVFDDARLAQRPRRATAAAITDLPARTGAVEFATVWSVADGTLELGLEYGCRVEFWTVDPRDAQLVVPPLRDPRAGPAHRSHLAPATVVVDGVTRPSVALFDRAFVEDVTFPVDVVYTWVDGDDPVWRERMLRARAEDTGTEYHPEAQGANRFASRDELRYSLRSLEMYAPWVRHVYVVTDGQRPGWLAEDHPGLTLVDHRDIYSDPGVLPVFNSSAIITQLHHIDGLSEHYLYLNDDMFLGSDVVAEDFFFGNGIAKVFPSRVPRAFAPAGPDDAPHLNISKNIRALLEQHLGVSMTRAIRHTGYPQLRSVNAEIERRFPDVVAATAGHRFRHHDDIALDQLFHYYAQAVGRAVPAEITYDYVNVGDAATVVRLRRLLAGRDMKVFCLNDAPDEAEAAVPEAEIAAFLRAYFPLPSRWERPGH